MHLKLKNFNKKEKAIESLLTIWMLALKTKKGDFKMKLEN